MIGSRTFALVFLSIMTGAYAQDKIQSKSFGARQVEQMLDDRPDMQTVIKPDDVVYKWVVSAFEGGGPQHRVYWNATLSKGEFAARHAQRYSVYPAQKYVSDDATVSGLEKWFCVVFELFNLDNEIEQRKLCALALNKDINLDQFADACVELERKAEKRVVRFLESTLPADHPLLTCDRLLASEFSKNRKQNGRWDYGPNRAYFLEYIRSIDLRDR